MTNKTPVYHRTSDGRKVVILKRYEYGYCKCYVVDDESMVILYAKELTPWQETETRTVYVCWPTDNIMVVRNVNETTNNNMFKAIKKLTITEGEFDD